MKKHLILIVALLSSLAVHSQVSYSEAELKLKCDSILEESNTLYRYETAAWNFTDMFLAKPEIMETIQGVLIYQKGDTIKCIVIDNQSQCSYEATFLGESAPVTELKTHRNLSDDEARLIKMKEKIRGQLSGDKYDVYNYKEFPLNWILIPFDDGYKFYAISGTSKGGVVPLGNDYLFIADKEGEMQSWKRFHSQLIPIEANEDSMLALPIHSHLEEEPFISATDICTFRLYYNQIGCTKFAVYSPALSVLFVYDIATNTITVTNDLDFLSTPSSEDDIS